LISEIGVKWFLTRRKGGVGQDFGGFLHFLVKIGDFWAKWGRFGKNKHFVPW
jgi:hypothetical protein